MSIAPSKDRAKPPAGRVHGSNRRVRAPGAQGLYDPRFEHDVGRGLGGSEHMAETALLEHFRQPPLAGLGAESESDLL